MSERMSGMINPLEQVIKGIGHHNIYGCSVTFDALEAIENALQTGDANNIDDDSPINILLINPGDVRHILTTISKRRRHKKGGLSKRKLHFYLLEQPIENIARQLLMLEIINDYEVPIRQRCNIFLEVLGNIRVQERTAKYIEQLGYQLRSLIGDGSGRLEDLVDLSLLKYKDRDQLEDCFKSYSRGSADFNMEQLWDARLRAYYAERYDARKAVADYDWHESIRPSASIVHPRLYKDWRYSGIAFEFGDQVYSESNRTMSSYTEGFMKRGKDKGMKKEVRGFWGDIVSSPFLSFGTDCDTQNVFAEGLFEIQNKNTGSEQHRHNTVEIAVYNMFQILWEIETGRVYAMTKANDIYSGLGAEPFDRAKKGVVSTSTAVDDENEDNTTQDDLLALDRAKKGVVSTSTAVDDENEDNTTQDDLLTLEDVAPPPPPDNDAAPVDAPPADEQLSSKEEEEEMVKALQRAESIVESFDGVKVFPLCSSPSIQVSDLLNKPKYTDAESANKFDLIFVSNRLGKCLDQPYFKQLLRPHGVLAVETGKYLVALDRKTKKALREKEEQLCLEVMGLHPLKPPPVRRRNRDETDSDHDVLFYSNK